MDGQQQLSDKSKQVIGLLVSLTNSDRFSIFLSRGRRPILILAQSALQKTRPEDLLVSQKNRQTAHRVTRTIAKSSFQTRTWASMSKSLTCYNGPACQKDVKCT